MEKHKQYYLEEIATQSLQNTGVRDSANVLAMDKTFIVKNKVYLGEFEMEVKYGQKIGIKTINQADPATYQIKQEDYLIAVKDVGVARTITLPPPATIGIGKIFVVKDVSGSCSATTITINPHNSETIDGDTSTALNINFESLSFFTDGTNWYIY